MKKFNEIAFLILLAVLFISILIVPYVLDMPDIYIIDNKLVNFSEGWTWKGDGYKGKYNLPYHFDVGKSESLVIRNTIPDDLAEGSFIAMKSITNSVIAKIDGETVYEIGTDGDKFLGRDFGMFWVFIKTKSEYKGKEIELSLFSNRAATQGFVSEVFIGSESALYANIFFQKGLWNIFSIVLFILGAMIIISYFLFGIYKYENRALFYLGIFAFIMGNWLVGESQLLQLMIKNTYYSTRITYLMTLLAPIPACLLIKEAVPMKKKRFFDDFIITLAIINAAVSIGLELSDILGLPDSIHIAMGLTVVLCVYYFAILLIEAVAYKNIVALKELKSLFIVFIAGIIEIVAYYANGQRNTSYFLHVGVSIYVVLIIIHQFNDYKERRRIKEEKEYFEKMAYVDAMTGAENRARYIEDIENISEPEGIVVVQADTDRLKYINDSFGHHYGDKSIIDTYKVLNKNFADMGKVYRTGGDEFAVIIKNGDINEVAAIIEKIRKDVDLIDKEREYKFSISLGVAEYETSLDEDIYSTTLRAERNMYEDKKRLGNTVPSKTASN